jgi:hypothetical protein
LAATRWNIGWSKPLIEIAAEPGDLRLGILGRNGLAGEGDLALAVDDKRFNRFAEPRERSLHASVGRLVDQKAGHARQKPCNLA